MYQGWKIATNISFFRNRVTLRGIMHKMVQYPYQFVDYTF